jgi:hypothetical protein
MKMKKYPTLMYLMISCNLALFACHSSDPEVSKLSTTTPFNLELNLSQLMNQVIDPAADIVWDSVSWISSTKGEIAKSPKTDADWEKVRNAASTVLEASNLLLIEPRAMDHEGWYQSAKLMGDKAKVILDAINARNADAVFASGSELDSACEACHIKYAHFEKKSTP